MSFADELRGAKAKEDERKKNKEIESEKRSAIVKEVESQKRIDYILKDIMNEARCQAERNRHSLLYVKRIFCAGPWDLGIKVTKALREAGLAGFSLNDGYVPNGYVSSLNKQIATAVADGVRARLLKEGFTYVNVSDAKVGPDVDWGISYYLTVKLKW